MLYEFSPFTILTGEINAHTPAHTEPKGHLPATTKMFMMSNLSVEEKFLNSNGRDCIPGLFCKSSE